MIDISHSMILYGEDRITPAKKVAELSWVDGPSASLDKTVVATVAEPFKPDGGLSVLEGNLGRAVMKTSALRDPHCTFTAPAVVFEDQFDLDRLWKIMLVDNSLNKFCSVWYAICVVLCSSDSVLLLFLAVVRNVVRLCRAM